MTFYPSQDEFIANHNKNQSQLVWSIESADILTPVSVALNFSDDEYCCLFESVEGGANRARYSFLALMPDKIWHCDNSKAYLNQEAQSDQIFDSLKSFIAESKLEIPKTLPSMAAGIFGFMGYDMVRYMEKLPDNNPDSINIPEALYIRPQIVIIFDSVKDEMLITTPIWTKEQASTSPEDLYKQALKRIELVKSKINTPINNAPHPKPTARSSKFKSNTTREEYHQMVEKAKSYIMSGDIFQVVPSQRFQMDFTAPAIEMYRSLRRLNPSPFSFFIKLGNFTLVGSSPEILVKLKDNTVTVRPIAGTRKRGLTKEEDQELSNDLLSDEKELAEHLMLVDLGRNDVGRVAKTATVTVTESKIIEYYSHVMHIVSNVQGKISNNKDALDAFIAGFPVGTVTGAPKIRAMEIIDELEKERRSYYAGGVGYFSSNGELDSCITLRTALIKDNTLYVQAGGGVVADSDPEAEYQESCNKAKAVLNAAREVS